MFFKVAESRLLLTAVGIMTIVLALLIVPPTVPQNTLWWDYLMALGYIATALLLILPLVTTRFWFLLGGDASESRAILTAHRIITYVLILFLVLHVAGLLIVDPLVIEYLKPSAPWGMIAALLATVAIVVSTVQSECRIKFNMRYNRWRSWHGVLTVVMVAGTFFHILEAKYFTRSISEFFALGALSIAAGGLIFLVRKNYQPHMEKKHNGGGHRIMRATILLAVLSSVLVFLFAIPTEGNRAERQALQCLQQDC